MARRIVYPFKQIKNVSIKSVTIAETDGHNEEAARFRTGTELLAFEGNVWAEGIVAVDEKPVETPYFGWKNWNSKTLHYFRQCWEDMNGEGDGDVSPIGLAQDEEEVVQEG